MSAELIEFYAKDGVILNGYIIKNFVFFGFTLWKKSHLFYKV